MECGAGGQSESEGGRQAGRLTRRGQGGVAWCSPRHHVTEPPLPSMAGLGADGQRQGIQDSDSDRAGEAAYCCMACLSPFSHDTSSGPDAHWADTTIAHCSMPFAVCRVLLVLLVLLPLPPPLHVRALTPAGRHFSWCSGCNASNRGAALNPCRAPSALLTLTRTLAPALVQRPPARPEGTATASGPSTALHPPPPPPPPVSLPVSLLLLPTPQLLPARQDAAHAEIHGPLLDAHAQRGRRRGHAQGLQRLQGHAGKGASRCCGLFSPAIARCTGGSGARHGLLTTTPSSKPRPSNGETRGQTSSITSCRRSSASTPSSSPSAARAAPPPMSMPKLPPPSWSVSMDCTRPLPNSRRT